MDHGFTFDGRHVHDMGAAFLASKWPGSAKATINEAAVSGRHGSYRYGGQTYSSKSFEGTLYLLDPDDELMSYTRMMERVDEVTPWLSPGGRRELILDAQPNRFYAAEITHEISFETDEWENGAASIEFILQPFAYALGLDAAGYTLAASVEQSKTLALGGNMEAPLLAHLTAAADITWMQITVGSKVLRLEGMDLSSGDAVEIDAQPMDGEVMTVRINGTASRGYVTRASAFPLFLQPGSNVVKAKADGACILTVQARGRWK